jgi:hypothetical protein
MDGVDPIEELAQKMCDEVRRKSPLPHVYWSIGDPPCAICLDKAEKQLAGKNRRNHAKPHRTAAASKSPRR